MRFRHTLLLYIMSGFSLYTLIPLAKNDCLLAPWGIVFWVGIHISVIANMHSLCNLEYDGRNVDNIFDIINEFAGVTFFGLVAILQSFIAWSYKSQYNNNILYIGVVAILFCIYIIPFYICRIKIPIILIIMLLILSSAEGYHLNRCSMVCETTMVCPVVDCYAYESSRSSTYRVVVLKKDGTERDFEITHNEYQEAKDAEYVDVEIYKGLLGIEEWRVKIE